MDRVRSITINGVTYEPVDTPIKEGMDISCKQCDIYKAREPKSITQQPLCYESGNKKALQSCYKMSTLGVHRIWKTIK